MGKKVVIFDLDDTLIPNVVYYRETKEKLYSLFIKIFGDQIDKEDFLNDICKIDLEKVKKLGLSRTRFPLTAVELYHQYCQNYGKSPICDEIDDVVVCASEVFDTVEKLSDECIVMIETIKNKGYEVFVLTSGDEIVQTYKIMKSLLYQFINNDNIIIVPQKTEDTYRDYFGKYGMDKCCMIGNSRKSDINPALQNGMFAIFIPEDTWEYEHATLKESDRLYTTNDLTRVPEILDEILR